MNTMGGYECQCNHGYEHDVSGRYCVDMDECKTNTSCGDNAECINIKGSFYCRCHRGFVKNDDGEFSGSNPASGAFLFGIFYKLKLNQEFFLILRLLFSIF